MQTDREQERENTEDLVQPVTVYTGPAWLADLKVRFGQWLEERRH